MVSVLDSGSSGPGSSPGQGTALCSWARHFTLTVPLFTQVYKWVPVTLLLEDNPLMDGGEDILLVASYYGNLNKLQPNGSYVDFTVTMTFISFSS